MEIMKKEIAATQYIYPENDETFDTCDDLSKNEGIPHNSILFFVLWLYIMLTVIHKALT